MRDPANIAAVGRLEPDFMGFIFYEQSPRFAGDLAPEALDVLPARTKRVGVFVDETEARILELMERYMLDYVQLHGSESPEMCARLRAEVGVIKAFGVAEAEDVARAAEYEGTCDYYIFDTRTPTHGGSGRRFDHDLLKSYNFLTPFMLSGGIGPENMTEDAAVLRQLGLRHIGYDINSRFELEPGLKNEKFIAKFLNFARTCNVGQTFWNVGQTNCNV